MTVFGCRSGPDSDDEEQREELFADSAPLQARLLQQAADFGAVTGNDAHGDNQVWTDEADAALRVDVSAVSRLRKLRESVAEDELAGDVYEARLRRQLSKMQGSKSQSWTVPDDSTDSKSVLKSASSVLAQTQRTLPRDVIKIQRCADANVNGRSDAVVRSVRFHPGGAPLLVTAGMDKRLRFFSVSRDDRAGDLLQQMFFPDLPIFGAEFVRGGDEVIAVGRRKFCYVCDLATGATRRVPGLSGGSGGCKSLETISVARDGNVLAAAGEGGRVLLVNAKTMCCTGVLRANAQVDFVYFFELRNICLLK